MEIKYLKYKDDVQYLLIEHFPHITVNSLKYDVTPATFEKLGESHGYEVEWKNPSACFGSYWLDFDDEEILNKLLKPSFFEGQDILIITDEYIKEKRVPVINGNELVPFIDLYGEHFKMYFFQPLDMIIATLDFSRIFIIHHEEYYCHISRG